MDYERIMKEREAGRKAEALALERVRYFDPDDAYMYSDSAPRMDNGESPDNSGLDDELPF